jgi:hypothetical protein
MYIISRSEKADEAVGITQENRAPWSWILILQGKTLTILAVQQCDGAPGPTQWAALNQTVGPIRSDRRNVTVTSTNQGIAVLHAANIPSVTGIVVTGIVTEGAPIVEKTHWSILVTNLDGPR